MNAVEIEEAITALSEQPFDAAEFPFAFLLAFGNKETTIKRLRSGASNKSDVGGILQTSNIHIKVAASGETGKTLATLKASPATARSKARFVLATDGADFEAEDLETGETVACTFGDFPNHFGFFLPLAGITTVKQVRESSFDIRATSRLNRLYRTLLEENPDWDVAERRPEMNHFMARLIFCFFAEDTDIFNGTGLFTATIEQMSARDSSNTHEVIQALFRAMNTKIGERAAANLPRWADAFPYVNGELFSGSIEVPRFSKIARSYLLHIGNLDWTKINPDIFGSMIQAVADDEERGALGMHYTSVPNILKVLNPLFLDDLRNKLEEAADNTRSLLNLRKRMAKIRVFDPACGSGNFLVIAYKEMRAIEAEINRRRGEPDRRTEIPLTNFRGIELRDFPAEVARLALIIAEFQCDVLYRGQKEALAEFLPLDAQNWITCGNALRLDWLSVCPPTGTGVKLHGDDLFSTPLDQAQIDFENEGGETYVCGNPPYLGAKKKTAEQIRDMDVVGLSNEKLLDYVAAFIIKAADYVRVVDGSFALVATSSICQGEQVCLLWPKILDDLHIKFAYRPFQWSNLASNNAGVWCTVVGVGRNDASKAVLFDGANRKTCASISPYLIEGRPVYVFPEKAPIADITPIFMGSNPVDGKRLIFERAEWENVVTSDPRAEMFFKRYGGTEEIISKPHRYCLWISDADAESAKSIAPIADAIERCRSYREGAGQDARRVAKYPHRFSRSTYQNTFALHIGSAIGNKFSFLPVVLREAGYVSNHTAFTLYNPKGYELAILTSTLHRVWAEAIAGRLGNGVRYAATVVYNTFPMPDLTEKNLADLTRVTEEILLSREAHFPATIADLYDPENMPADLREAHERNDEVLERIYIGRRFRNDTERLEKLFELYTKISASPGKAAKAKKAVSV
ncbi:MAG: class I SAM-dependent DNA methyltransferase [Brucella sp.]